MIDYVIISSDDNPMYKDFYPIVAKRWYDIGYKTYFINITDEDDIIENEYGIIHKIKSVGFMSSGLQSQIARIYCSNFFDGVMLTSDIDMLPINSEYFIQYNSELVDNKVIIYSGQPYGDTPYFPMCYILANTIDFRRYMEIADISFADFCKRLLTYKAAWNTDENYMYDMLSKHFDKLIIKNRDFSRRVDRGNWIYNDDLLKSGYYIDSHLLRPYLDNKERIDELINKI